MHPAGAALLLKPSGRDWKYRIGVLISVIGLGVVVFATTNLDDILLLSAFFADRALRVRNVVIGQFAGIGVLTAASALAALLALAIPEGWIGLLGLAPCWLGIQRLHGLWRSRQRGQSEKTDDVLEMEARARQSTHAQWVAVAFVTMANGGDNLGVYIPLFSRQLSWVPVYALVFAAMTAMWCALGYWLVHHPIFGARIGIREHRLAFCTDRARLAHSLGRHSAVPLTLRERSATAFGVGCHQNPKFQSLPPGSDDRGGAIRDDRHERWHNEHAPHQKGYGMVRATLNPTLSRI